MSRILAVWALIALPVRSAAADPAALERAREDCATELSMFCAERKDAVECLQEQRGALTSRCRSALDRPAGAPAAAAPASSGAAPAAAPVSGPPPGAVPVPGVANVWFDGEFSGPRQDLYPKFRDAIAAEVPGALRGVAELLGQPEYASAFPHPLTIRIEYDPTQENGLGGLDEDGPGGGGGLRMTFNMAHWEDCPSKPVLRSIVTHELSHAVLHDLVGEGRLSYVPQWFDEGLAMLAGGEPSRSITLESAYYHHGRDYPSKVSCPLDNGGQNLATMALLGDCYPFYLLAVQSLKESSSKALPDIVGDLRSGGSLQDAVSARTSMPWSAMERAAQESAQRAFKAMSPLSYVTGRGWWRQLRWCRG